MLCATMMVSAVSRKLKPHSSAGRVLDRLVQQNESYPVLNHDVQQKTAPFRTSGAMLASPHICSDSRAADGPAVCSFPGIPASQGIPQGPGGNDRGCLGTPRS